MPNEDEMSASVDAAEVVLRLVNTHDHGGRLTERLGDSTALREWLAGEPSAAGDDGVVTPADVVEVREIRDALATLLLAHVDASCTEDELAVAEQALRRASSRYPLQADISRDGAGLTPTRPGLAGLIGSVLAATVELSQSGMWHRMKACRNCYHAFLDQSRNRSAGYCGPRCSSQAGMRAYRSRQQRKTES